MQILNTLVVGPDWARVGNHDPERNVTYDLTVRGTHVDEVQLGCTSDFVERMRRKKGWLQDAFPGERVVVTPKTVYEMGFIKIFFELSINDRVQLEDLGAFWAPGNQEDFNRVAFQIETLCQQLAQAFSLEHF